MSQAHLWTCCLPDFLVTISNHNVSHLAFGTDHCLFLTTNGNVCSFGKGRKGQLGVGSLKDQLKEPQIVQGIPEKVISIACGPETSAAVCENGELYMWGDNSYGQCGVDSNESVVLVPTLVQILESPANCNKCDIVLCKKTLIVEVSCGLHHTIARSKDYEIWTWGEGPQLGLTNVNRTGPAKLEFLKGKHVLSVASGAFHSIAVLEVPKVGDSSDIPEKQHTPISLCSKCKCDQFTITDSSDAVIVTRDHVCPLGLLVADEDVAITSALQEDKLELKIGDAADQKSEEDNKERPNELVKEMSPLSPCNSNKNKGEFYFPDNVRENYDKPEKITEQILDSAESAGDLAEESVNDQTNDNYQQVTSTDDDKKVILHNHDTLDQSSREFNTAVNEEEIMSEYHPDAVEVKGTEVKANILTLENGEQVELRNKTVQFQKFTDASTETSTSEEKCLQACHQSKRHSSLIDHVQARQFLEKQISNVSTRSKARSVSVKSEDSMSIPPDDSIGSDKYPLMKGLMTKVKTTVDKFHYVAFGSRNSQSSHSDSVSSQESFEVIEVEHPGPDEIQHIKRTGSLKSLLEIKQAYKLKSINRKGSIEVLVNKSRIKGSVQERSQHSIRKKELGRAAVQTEVWSWGVGEFGQLGHGDELVRPQPCCVKQLSGQGVVRVLAGDFHSIALTADCRIFTWGLNDVCQLGHNLSNEKVLSPKQLQLPHHELVWDVATGSKHTLVLADVRVPNVALYFCGAHERREDGEDCSCSKGKPSHISVLRKTGLVTSVFAGGPYSGCIVDEQGVGEITVLHEFAASERKYLHQLQKIIHNVLIPIIKNDTFKQELAAVYMKPVQNVVARIADLVDIVAMNSYDLTLIAQGRNDLDSLYMLDSEEEWLDLHWAFFQVLCDVVAVKAIPSSAKCISFSPNLLKTSAKDIIGEMTWDERSTIDIVFQLISLPLRRVKDYIRLFTRLTAISPKYLYGKDIQHTVQKWKQLSEYVDRNMKQAEETKTFWDNAPQKLVDTFRIASRRLVRESKSHPLSLVSSGRFSTHSFILFSDVLVHSYFGGFHSHALETVWVEPLQDTEVSQNAFVLTMPEDTLNLTCCTSSEKTGWICALNNAIKKTLDGHIGLATRGNIISMQRLTPPLARQATYTFVKHPTYKDATYTGMWFCGKIHGPGKLIFADGKTYVGKFKHSIQDGEGTYTIPSDDGRETVYEGMWKEGKLNGLGCVKYPNGDSYEGYFKDGMRHGHGILKQGKFLSSPSSIYIGQWSWNRREGYGVLDNIRGGEKYMGMWHEDFRHGKGLVVTIDGIYYEGTFISDKLSGFGKMIFEDNTCYEGELGPGGIFNGKGTLYMSNGDKIEGTFNGSWSEAIKLSGLYHKSPGTPSFSPEIDQRRHFGKLPLCVMAEQKWEDIFDQCKEILCIQGASAAIDNKRAWEAVAVAVNKRKKEVQSKKKWHNQFEDSLDFLERIPYNSSEQGQLTLENYRDIQNYLQRSCDCPFHPLGHLLEGLVDVYRASYLGVGAHPRLLVHAVAEIHSFVARIYNIVRILFPDLPCEVKPLTLRSSRYFAEEFSSSHSESDDDDEDDISRDVVTPSSLLHPVLLPRLYPTLFTLYALECENEDEHYWERLLKWNKQSDIALMTFLGVDRKLLGICDGDFLKYPKKSPCPGKRLLAKAIETLQHISTAFTPLMKLRIIHEAFEEINKEFLKKLKTQFLWTMDDLFPVFQFVVVRAAIRHLGSEIHFIEDMMEPHLQNGELGIMFTTLKACYFQIKTEKLSQT
ncbi:amyotrophic lateral sclerosis 2 [Tachypleus tridentatus]|uniref:amyotrophic lateral sclerosis 2 n=1 Tax=Tachypleus tridentatus TaxID=6853 RepID=UPI003FD5CE9E